MCSKNDLSTTLFIMNSIELGGVETFFLRMAKANYISHGTKTNILVMSSRRINKELEQQLEEYSNVFFLHEIVTINFKFLSRTSARVLSLFPLSDFIINEKFKNIEKIHAIDEISLVLAERIRKKMTAVNKDVITTVGVYHSRLFAWGNKSRFYSYNLPKMIFSKFLPEDNVVFFNDNSKNINREFFNVEFANSPIIPIGVVDKKKINMAVDMPTRKKIVSVGRLVDFKKYNINIINALDELSDCSTDIEYHIYGDGPELSTLLSKVKTLKLEDRVYFHGNIDYSKFHDVVSDAWCFVGSGTALIEAGSYLVPCIVGVESHNQTTGFFNPTLGVNYNEYNHDIQHFEYSALIKELYLSNATRYSELAEESKQASDLFDINKSVYFFSNTKFVMADACKINFSRYILSTVLIVILSRLVGYNSYNNRLDS